MAAGSGAYSPSSLFALHWDVCVPLCRPQLPSAVALELSRAALDLVTGPAVAASLPVSLPPRPLVFPGITLQIKHGPVHHSHKMLLRDWNQAFSMALRLVCFFCLFSFVEDLFITFESEEKGNGFADKAKASHCRAHQDINLEVSMEASR